MRVFHSTLGKSDVWIITACSSIQAASIISRSARGIVSGMLRSYSTDGSKRAIEIDFTHQTRVRKLGSSAGILVEAAGPVFGNTGGLTF
jgi:hypothetical protein